ncbi:hypothetical protein C8F04DRAFT_1188424 [Mycena alexandri]|uniref:Uncharacterized protein n=1 Tax=Mycena alexandri TaxID=1745969 RepID=A0AAD6SLU5_9AGAR|nr:hypothetical protein C8F04DRAFT_1188424 [Mycena alexandri]
MPTVCTSALAITRVTMLACTLGVMTFHTGGTFGKLAAWRLEPAAKIVEEIIAAVEFALDNSEYDMFNDLERNLKVFLGSFLETWGRPGNTEPRITPEVNRISVWIVDERASERGTR